MQTCLNCATELRGKYCHECSQKVLEPSDRTVKHFVYQFFGSAFFLENNFLKNLYTLIKTPGQLPLDYMEGRRKRWMPPISVFLLINLFYFLVTPLTDLNLRLHEQLKQFQHRRLANELVDQRLKGRDITMDEYAAAYNKRSTSLSNSLIILHIPVFAFFLALIFYRKRYYFVDHFIYGLYFIAAVLLFALVQAALLYPLIKWLGALVFGLLRISLLAFILFYLFFSLKRVYKLSNLIAALAVFPVFLAFVVSHFLYRTILFLTVFLFT